MSGRAEQCKQAGNAAFKAGEYELAVAHYSTAIQLDPSVATYPLNRALVHLKLANPRDAETDASTALALDGGRGPKALFRRALARKALGNLDGARSDLQEAKRQGAGDEVDNELAALTNQLGIDAEPKVPAPSPASRAKAPSPSTERLRASVASPSSSPPTPAKSTSDGLMTAVSSRRLTPSNHPFAQPSTPAPAPEPAPSVRTSFAAKKEARVAKQQQPPRRAPAFVVPEEADVPPPAAPASASTDSLPMPLPASSSPPPVAATPSPIPAPAPRAVAGADPGSVIPASFLLSTPSAPPPPSATALETHFLLTPPGTPSRLALLRALDPHTLGAFFGAAGVGPELLSAILAEVVPRALAAQDDDGGGGGGDRALDWVVPLLRGLTVTRRWDAAVLFLDEGEREGVRRVLEREEERVRRTKGVWGV
ncbi:hypothetical protein JCM3770_003065 [Rhodotorula araucariae]